MLVKKTHLIYCYLDNIFHHRLARHLQPRCNQRCQLFLHRVSASKLMIPTSQNPHTLWFGASTQIGIRVVFAAMDAIAAASTLRPSSVPCSRQWRTGAPCKVCVQVPVKGEHFGRCEFSSVCMCCNRIENPFDSLVLEQTASFSVETALTGPRSQCTGSLWVVWSVSELLEGVSVGRNGRCDIFGG